MQFTCSTNSSGSGNIGIVYVFECIPADTLLGSVDTFNLKFSIDNITPTSYRSTFGPINDNPLGLYLSFTTTITPDFTYVYSDFVVVNGVVNLPNNNSISVQMMRNQSVFPASYLFERTDPESGLFSKATITINPIFSVVSDDDVSDGPGTPVSPESLVAASTGSLITLSPRLLTIVPESPITASDSPQIFLKNIMTDGSQSNSLYSFYIIDTVRYSDGYYCESKHIMPNLYRTDYIKYPQFQSVIVGNNCCCSCSTQTLLNKLTYIINNVDNTYSFENLLFLISFYAATRYILSRFLFGDFNEKYLLGNYYRAFLSRLRTGRFQHFYKLFTEPVNVMLNNVPTTVDFSSFTKYFLNRNTMDSVCGSVSDSVCGGNTTGCSIKIRPVIT